MALPKAVWSLTEVPVAPSVIDWLLPVIVISGTGWGSPLPEIANVNVPSLVSFDVKVTTALRVPRAVGPKRTTNVVDSAGAKLLFDGWLVTVKSDA